MTTLANITQDIWILIPAYNEASSISSVIQDLRKNGYDHILVIDDGSHDNTREVAHAEGAEVLTHIVNLGQGAALKTGLEYLRETLHPDIIVTFDADGQHCAEDISSLIDPLLNGKADIVLGSRFLGNQTTIPWFRKVILKLGVLFTNVISHIHLTDTHNGLRALSPKAYNSIEITHRGMEHASDIIDEISSKKLCYCEQPVHIIYSEYSIHKGQPTSNFLKIALKIILKKLL